MGSSRRGLYAGDNPEKMPTKTEEGLNRQPQTVHQPEAAFYHAKNTPEKNFALAYARDNTIIETQIIIENKLLFKLT